MKTITDHELSEIANDWAKEIPYENIGIRTAFAAGYRLAEKQANGVQSENGKLPIPFVRVSALIKRFSEWNNKYPKGRIYSINSKDGMEMMRELDELADEAQEMHKHLP